MKANVKRKFNKWYSKPIGIVLMFVSITAMCAADGLADAGRLHWLFLGMFVPMTVMFVMQKHGLMEWVDKGKID
jgi:hypothetical protein